MCILLKRIGFELLRTKSLSSCSERRLRLRWEGVSARAENVDYRLDYASRQEGCSRAQRSSAEHEGLKRKVTQNAFTLSSLLRRTDSENQELNSFYFGLIKLTKPNELLGKFIFVFILRETRCLYFIFTV